MSDPQFHLKMPRNSNRSKQAEVIKEEVEYDDKDEDFSSDSNSEEKDGISNTKRHLKGGPGPVTKVTKSLKETVRKHIDLPAKATRRSGTTIKTIQTAPSLMDVPGKEELIGNLFLQKAGFITLIL